MKNLFLIVLLSVVTINLKAQTYGITIDDLVELFKGDPAIIKQTLTSHGFVKSTGNLWLTKIQPTLRKSSYSKEDSHLKYLFYGGQNFFVVSPDATLKLLLFSFDVKYLSYYLTWFGKLGYSGLYSKASLYIDGEPTNEFSTAEFTLTTSELNQIEIRIEIWKDRCQLTMMSKL